jgi:predicted transcriptional regulator
MSSTNPLVIARQAKGLSVAEAAKACGVPRTHWYKYEANTIPRFDIGLVIERVLGVTRTQLLTWQEGQQRRAASAMLPVLHQEAELGGAS